jgi:hypothetical protein
MWIKLFNKFINLSNVEMVELYEGKDGRRIEIHFVSDSVITLWESAEGKDDFDKVWKIFYEGSLNSISK